MSTKISAILLSYSRPEYLSDALQSIARQTRLPDELILSDCTPPGEKLDHIQQIVNDFKTHTPKLGTKITYHSKPIEQTAHTHFAFQQCRFPVLAMLHDDDVWLPHHLERSLAKIEQSPSVGLCISSSFPIDSGGRRLTDEAPSYPDLPSNENPNQWFKYLVRRYFSSFSGYVFRTEITTRFPKFATQVVDHHLALQTTLQGFRISSFASPSLEYRIHSNSENESITQRFSLQRERYKLFAYLLATSPIACTRRMPLFPIFVLNGLVRLLRGRS